jgi:hypothetical protein
MNTKKILIGCGIALGIAFLAFVVLIVAGTMMFRSAIRGKLVGSIAIQQIQVHPESPTPDDPVSLRVEVAFAGTGDVPPTGLPLQVSAQEHGKTDKVTGTATLLAAAGAGPSGVFQGSATLEIGKLPEGPHEFLVLAVPPGNLIGAATPPQPVTVTVKPKPGP